MSFRSFRAFASLALCSGALAACGTGSGILAVAGSGDAATVRFVNATATPLDLVTGGSVNAGNANIVSGGGIGCFAVADPTVAQLTVRRSGTTDDLTSFSPILFSANGRYTLVAFPTATGAIQVVGIPTTGAVPVPGRSALRVFHALSGAGLVDVYVTVPGAALDVPTMTSVPFGAFNGSPNVPPGAVQVRLTNTATTTVVFDSGSRTVEAGKSYTLIVSSATPAILVPDC
jgi:hypothetical protein